MDLALQTLKSKSVEISDEEYEASLIAILLHDIGHGPFSHALEYSLLEGVNHEDLSVLIIRLFNVEFKNQFDLSLKIINGEYKKVFLTQLVSSQLDVDRLDYINRDSFFTGVSEGKIGFERILKMLNVVNNNIVVEEKAIYSIENFLSSRRLMYWQVYLHKTTVGAEKLLIQLIKRAKYLAKCSKLDTANNSLRLFLLNDYQLQDFNRSQELLVAFLCLDDHDIWGSIKIWQHHPDKVLSELSRMLIERDLFRVRIASKPFKKKIVQEEAYKISEKYHLSKKDAYYFIASGALSNAAYELKSSKINVVMKNGDIVDIALASDLPNIKAMSKIVKKYYLCTPKSVSL